MSRITIEIDHVDAMVLRTVISEGIKRYDDSIAFWNSDERTMSPEGRATVIETLQQDQHRLRRMSVDIGNRLDAIRRRYGVSA